MSKAIADISMSLDEYPVHRSRRGPGARPRHRRRGDPNGDVVVMGGANVIDQSLAARLADELRIHLSPLVLGDGTRLFDLGGPTRLVQQEVIRSPQATHLTYEVVRE